MKYAEEVVDEHEYNAMMIVNAEGFANRAGLGMIRLDSTLIAAAQWKEILLG